MYPFKVIHALEDFGPLHVSSRNINIIILTRVKQLALSDIFMSLQDVDTVVCV